jgi:hypothetical protein
MGKVSIEIFGDYSGLRAGKMGLSRKINLRALITLSPCFLRVEI